MKLLGYDIKEENKGYFGVRRCTECGNNLRDVDLTVLSKCFYILGIPIKTVEQKHFLVCKNCKASLHLNTKMWKYYATYLNERFSKRTTDEILNTLSTMNKDLVKNGINLNSEDEAFLPSLDLIYKKMVEKYGTWQNVEEIISVFYQF